MPDGIVKLQAALPNGMANGVAELDARLIEEPKTTLVCVCELGVDQIVVKRPGTDDEHQVVKLRILAIEPIEGSEVGFLLATANAARTNRTGVESLFGAVSSDEAPFVDPVTGEIPPEGDEPDTPDA